MADAWSVVKTSVLVDYLTAAELLAGCRNRREQRLIEQELRQYEVLWGSPHSSATALAWFKQYHLSHGVGFLDCLIGAVAEEAGAVLYTLNESHFSPFSGSVMRRPY